MTKVVCAKSAIHVQETKEIWSPFGAIIFAKWFTLQNPSGIAIVYASNVVVLVYCGQNVDRKSINIPLVPDPDKPKNLTSASPRDIQ